MESIFDIEFFKKINNAYKSKSKKETALYEIQKRISQTYDETIDYQPDTLVDGIPTPLIVMEYHGNNLDRDRIKKIEAPPGSYFSLGSKVDCFDLKWLVTEINYNDQVKLSGRLQLCNYVLKWLSDDGKIISEECVVKRYSNSADGEDVNKTVSVGDTRRNIFIQYNAETARITRGRRFFIDLEGVADPKVYRLTDIDRTTYIYNGRGFFNLSLVEDERRDVDRADLMIADYYISETLPFQPMGNCKIEYSGSAILKVGGGAKTFYARFYDEEGNELFHINPSWSLLPSNLQAEGVVEIVSQQGNEIKLVASWDAPIGESFALALAADDSVYGSFETQAEIEIKGLI